MMVEGSKQFRLKTSHARSGSLHVQVSSNDDAKQFRGPGWRAKVRAAAQKRREEGEKKNAARKRSQRRDRCSVRGRGR